MGEGMEDPAPAWTLGTAYTCQLCGQVTYYCPSLVTINISMRYSIRPSWALTCSVSTSKSATSQPTRLTGKITVWYMASHQFVTN